MLLRQTVHQDASHSNRGPQNSKVGDRGLEDYQAGHHDEDPLHRVAHREGRRVDRPQSKVHYL